MILTTDQQTLNDLSIFGRPGSEAIFNLYNRARTKGGAMLLEDIFRNPLSDAGRISRRSAIIRHFEMNDTVFPFGVHLFDAAEQYLAGRDERTRLSGQEKSLGEKFSSLIQQDTMYETIVQGVAALKLLLAELLRFMNSEVAVSCQAYQQERSAVMALLEQAPLAGLIVPTAKNKPSREELAVYDSVLRFRHYAEVRQLLQYMYSLDVYSSVAALSKERGYAFASAIDSGQGYLLLEGVRHPAVKGAKGNDILLDNRHNVVFLTGANMAGKSTFMKSVGIALYIAHTGLPVAVGKMEFSVMDGFYSTINLPDNLGMGASHFYAEVLRVKQVAVELSKGKRLFVLFDELFRGTNVKDANEATIAVVKGFAGKRDSLFIVSTHIIEAGDALITQSSSIRYRYLPTLMQGHQPVYTYKLEDGITEDRHGMVIIRNEGILDMLTADKAILAQMNLTE